MASKRKTHEPAKLKGLSKKGKKSIKRVLERVDFLTVWEGAVRSGKTVVSLLAFYLYVSNSVEKKFLMTGKTQSALFRNCIDGDFGFLALAPGSDYSIDMAGNRIITLGDKIIYCVGANDKRSFTKLRGSDMGGWYADEVNLHPENFIGEATRRTIASKDRRHMWTLNPDVPTHYIYKNFLDVYEREEADGYSYWHFLLDDNPVISDDRKEELKAQFRGFEYDRYILGKRVRVEGTIYNFSEDMIIKEIPNDIFKAEVGIDFGGSGSATTFVLVGYSHRYQKMIVIDEFYDDKNEDVTTVINNFKRFINKWKKKFPRLIDAYADSAEQLIIKQMRNSRTGVNIKNAKKTQISERIRMTNILMNTGRFLILEGCEHTINALTNAIYDPNGKRLDDGSYEVDCLDAMEYCQERHSKIGELMKAI